MPQAVILPLREPSGARESTQKLYLEHGPFTRALLARLLGPDTDPEDLLQEVFFLAWMKKVPDDGSARAWLSATAIRLALAERRRLRIRRLLRFKVADALDDWRTPQAEAEAQDARRLVYAALEGLSEKRRTVFILYELQGLSGPEISHALRCPPKTVRTRLFHARRDFELRLRALVKGKGEGRD